MAKQSQTITFSLEKFLSREVIGQYVATPPFQTFLIVRMRNRNSSLAELHPVPEP